MGQQQLLLLVLGIVLVGLAVTVGVTAFKENNRKSRIDLATSVSVRIASEALAWKSKPAAFGGGQGTAHLSEVDFVKLGYNTPSSSVYQVDIIDLRARFENLNTDAPRVSIREIDTSALVGAVIFGPTPECIVLQPGNGGQGWGPAPARPSGCVGW